MMKKSSKTFLQAGSFEPKNMLALHKKIAADATARKEAIKRIKKDFIGFLEDVFDLTPAQKLALRKRMPESVAANVASVCITALKHRTRIAFRPVKGSQETFIQAGINCGKPLDTNPEPPFGPEIGGGSRDDADWQCTATVSWSVCD